MNHFFPLLMLFTVLFSQTEKERIYESNRSLVKEIEIQFEKSTEPGKLNLDASIGTIFVENSSTDYPSVVIKLIYHDTDEDDSKKFFENFRHRSSARNNRLNVSLERNSRRYSRWREDANIEITAYLPKAWVIDAATSGGHIKGYDLKGNVVEARTSGGNISFEQCIGEFEIKTSGGFMKFESIEGSINARTSGGSITTYKVLGNVDVETSGGSITMEEITGTLEARTSGGGINICKITKSVDAQTSGGSINIEDIGGNTSVSTSGGSIHFKHIGGNLTAETSGGSIKGDGVNGVSLLETNSGGIKVYNAKGPVQARGTSFIHVELDLSEYTGNERTDIESYNGNVTVEITEKSSFDITIKSQSSHRNGKNKHIKSDFDLEYNDNRAWGKHNGGKHEIQIESSHGKVKVYKK